MMKKTSDISLCIKPKYRCECKRCKKAAALTDKIMLELNGLSFGDAKDVLDLALMRLENIAKVSQARN